MLKQFILFGAALLLVGCEPVHPCDIGASPVSCEIIESIPEPYMAFNNTTTPTVSVAERGTSTFTFKLLFKVPDGNVVVDLSTNDATEATLSPTRLTYTPANWETVQTVTITGPVDNITDGSQTSTITASINDANTNDNYYDAVTDKTMTLTTTDVDVDGMVMSSILGTVAETGSTATFTVALSSSPDCTGNVVIDLTDNDTDNSEISYTPTTLTYNASNWFTAQTVTITGQNDFLEDGNITNLITLAINDGSTCDTDYDSLGNSFYTATNTDDDTAGITITSGGGSTNLTEAGSTYVARTVLTAQPTSNVVIDITDNDTDNSEVSISPTSLTFTTGDWNTAQNITLTGRDDYKVDGNKKSLITLAVNGGSTADTDYSALSNQTFTVDTIDDDTIAVTLSKTTASVTEAGSTDTFTIRLGTQPSKTVQINLTDNDTDNSEISLGWNTTFYFTTSNWSTPQTVTITGRDDSIEDGNIVSSVTVAVSGIGDVDTDYTALADQTVSVTTVNDDFRVPLATNIQNISIYEDPTQNQNMTFDVRLGMAPSSNVVLDLVPTDSANVGRATISPAQLTFTSSNYNTNQTVTVSVVNDTNLDDNLIGWPLVIVVNDAASDDAWDSVDNVTKTVNNTLLAATIYDNEVRTFTTVGLDSIEINESGTSDTFTIVLDHALSSSPYQNVRFDFAPPVSTDFNVSPTQITFDGGNWSTPQTITISGRDNDDVDGTRTKQLYIMTRSNSSQVTVPPTSYSTLFGNITVSDNDTPTYGELAGSHYHYCMIRRTDGTVWCWGRNDDGQLGDGTTTSRHSPVQAGSLTGVVSIGLEESSTCALDNVSELHCWGKFFEGDGSTRTTYTSPQAMSGGSAPFGSIPAGTTFFGNANQDLYTFNGSSVRVVGNNSTGEHGEGDTTSNRAAVDPGWSITPTKFYVPEGGSGRNSACFLDNSSINKLYCMGDGAQGLFLDSSSSNRLTPVEMTHVDGRMDFAIGSKNFFYIDPGDYTLWCWGNQSSAGNGIGVCGSSSTTNYITSKRQIDLGQNRAQDVIASKDHACILYDANDGSTKGKVGCTGSGADGKLGMGNTSNRSQFPINQEILTNMQEIALTLNSTCAIDRYSKVYCVGDNTYGELGNAGQLGGADRVTPDSGWTMP